jgi:hypothetical protein
MKMRKNRRGILRATAALRMTAQIDNERKSRSLDFVTSPLTGARFTSLNDGAVWERVVRGPRETGFAREDYEDDF